MIWKTFLKKNRNHHAQVFYSSRRRVWTVKWMSRLASWWMRLLFILDLAPHPASHLFNAQPSPLPHPCTTREIAVKFIKFALTFSCSRFARLRGQVELWRRRKRRSKTESGPLTDSWNGRLVKVSPMITCLHWLDYSPDASCLLWRGIDQEVVEEADC